METKEEYLQLVRDFVKQNPDKEIYAGMGWINPAFDSLGPDKESLDEICSEKPIVLRSGDCHSFWTNTKAVEMLGITPKTPDPAGGCIERNPDGSIRGTFRDQAQNGPLSLIPEPTVEEYKACIEEFQNRMIGLGVTAVFDPMVDAGSNCHKAYREMNDAGELKIRMGLAYNSDPEDPMALLPLYEQEKDSGKGMLTEGTFVKVFIDGVVEGVTALLKDEYCNEPGYYGEALWKQDVLNAFCAAVDALGYDLHFHAIGDGATAQVIEAMAYAHAQNGSRERNTVIAHMQIVDPADYPKLKELGIRVSANPYWFVKEPGYFYGIEKPFLGERAETEYPMKTFFDLGLVVSGGSDFAVTPRPYPPDGMQFAMLRCMPEQDPDDLSLVLNPPERITLAQAIDVFTINGAITMGIEDVTGVAKPGMAADLVVMEQDLFETPPREFVKTEVYMTIADGKIVYRKE